MKILKPTIGGLKSFSSDAVSGATTWDSSSHTWDDSTIMWGAGINIGEKPTVGNIQLGVPSIKQ